MSSSSSRWNSSYHKQSDFQFAAGKKAIDSLDLKGDERVLDVGCGTGRTTSYCASKLTSGTVLGTDLSEEMIKFAQQEYKDNPRISFECIDATQLKYDQEFDVVISFFCLYWIKDQRTAIHNIVRGLKKGGRGMFLIPCEGDLARRWNAACAKVKNRYPSLDRKGPEYVFLQEPATWVALLSEAGAAVQYHEVVERTKVFKSRSELKQYLHALNIEPLLNSSERGQFLDLVTRELYSNYNLALDGPFNYTTSTLVINFTKIQ